MYYVNLFNIFSSDDWNDAHKSERKFQRAPRPTYQDTSLTGAARTMRGMHNSNTDISSFIVLSLFIYYVGHNKIKKTIRLDIGVSFCVTERCKRSRKV